jgi:spore maturation protein CgeB
MRFAILGSTDFDSIEFHLQDSLRFLGHEVKTFDLSFAFGKGKAIYYWLKRFSEKYDIRKGKQLAHDVLEYKPDVVIGVYRIIHPVTINLIKEKAPSIPLIHINPDALVTLEQQQIMASGYDHYFTKDPYMVWFMKDMAGLNAHYLPEAFNPRFHTPLVDDRVKLESEVDMDVLVFGNMYPYRTRIIEQVRNAGINVSVYGMRNLYFPEKLNDIFRDHKIVGREKAQKIVGARINLNCFHYSEIESVNVKYFEINGIGGFQLCDYKPVLKEYSPIDPARYSFTSTRQAIDLLRYYLAKPLERHEIAEMQRKHFLEHHTYENRMSYILDIIAKSN